MTDLPPALRPWAPWLDRLPLDLATALGDHAVRLDMAIGPLATSSPSTSGEVDGYDGLDRRGPYDRLLLGEWLLAEEIPDEFVRRAAMNEHLFLRQARRDPATARRSIALFDAGPEQLGSARAVQVAVAFALARRADAAGVPFEVGVLQRRGEVQAYAGPPTIEALLAARTSAKATSADVDACLAALKPSADDDVWLVGGRTVAKVAGKRSYVRLDEVEGLQTGRVAVEVRRPAGVARLELVLPPAERVAGLLRQPYPPLPKPRKPRATSPVPVTTGDFLRFSPDGRRLLARTTDGFVALHTPTSPRETAGEARRFVVPQGHDLLALGWHRRRFLAITRSQQRRRPLFAHRFEPLFPTIPLDRARHFVPYAQDGDDAPEPDGFVPPVGDDAVPLVLYGPQSGEGAQIVIATTDGALYRWCPATGQQRRWFVATRIEAISGGLTLDGANVVWIGGPEDTDARWLGVLDHSGAPRKVDVDLGSGPLAPVLEGAQLYNTPGLLAVPFGDGRWRLVTGGYGTPQTLDVAVPADVTPFGTAYAGQRPGVLAIGEDRRSIALHHDSGAPTRIALADGPILSACATTGARRIAWQTATETIAWSLDHGEAVLRVRTEGA